MGGKPSHALQELREVTNFMKRESFYSHNRVQHLARKREGETAIFSEKQWNENYVSPCARRCKINDDILRFVVYVDKSVGGRGTISQHLLSRANRSVMPKERSMRDIARSDHMRANLRTTPLSTHESLGHGETRIYISVARGHASTSR